MPSNYLQMADFPAYGLDDCVTQAQVQRASTMIDAYLERPEGLVWVPDGAGNPCYMAALQPSLSFTAPGAISPGTNVVVTVTGPVLAADIVGEALVLDRNNADVAETVVVTAAAGNQLTLKSVEFSHDAGALLEAGMTILEERSLPAKRSVTRLSRNPIVRLVSGMGRYAYGRRSDQVSGLYNDTNLLAALQTFGGPPAWMSFDVSQASVSVQTSEVWVPAGLMLAYYSDVRIRYLAGYPYAGLPGVVKQACADIVTKIQQFGDADPAFKMVAAGGTKLERFADTNIDTDTKALLEPFRAKLLF